MSVQALAAVLDHSQARLGARLVLIAIANHANEYGENAYPSIDTIGREAHLSPRQVIRCVQELEQLGELDVLRESNKANRYRILVNGLNRGVTNSHSIKGTSLTTKTYGSRDKSSPEMSPGDKLSPPAHWVCGKPIDRDGYCPTCQVVAS